ncbi:adenine deaminase C-terminal domain-containing protein [Geobacillus thermodenitrificans]|jgi:adenine deaminase|uniref:adenine deaminase C-terminal domain-containing protein n=1 Tax=Geobacillus thermodenitrificans TaxID=33940 RepID=UPI0003F864D9|nr:adenine deaminase C-terminal domain-containing protein [Geobacillus thermodenitrificans]ARA97918.1 adenosine deaminase [Geobacillus thermodenitrificans]ARP41296.1 Putative adenine deaminase [Geobacillus thermodenitrificans]MED3716192.1 adenine deaminase C-terminal domain-containing protein [Geobacillus thermodenitrificans]MED4916438.1 adenine deaminase C-terminal domain-containing protein [Geobacillus thermodenitrificans]
MGEQRYRWKSSELREQAAVIDGKRSPTKVLVNATYLHSYFREWVKGNIWIHGDRIVYAGERLPDRIDESCEIIDCRGYVLVPGYIEPHVHPFQLYNPHSFARYAATYGTTTLLNDNLFFLLQLDDEEALLFLQEMNALPTSMYWWCRFDGQTELEREDEQISNARIKRWLDQETVLQGGELTSWPKLASGDDIVLYWMQEAKRRRRKIEGHFPGASEKTLVKMALFGVDGDHEAMTGKEVRLRLWHGYTVTLRHSSIRPDLPVLLEEMKALGIRYYDKCLLTTDGSPPAFYENGVMDQLLRIVIEHGVPVIDAYAMATINAARHYGIEHLHGSIATGRIAHINFLRSAHDPTPVQVLAKGEWVKREGDSSGSWPALKWEQFGIRPLSVSWELEWDDLQFSMPMGLRLENAVIVKPYSVSIDTSRDRLGHDHDECFLMLLDRNGCWRVNTMLKGFSSALGGLASSYSNTGDFILIGKHKEDMMLAFRRMKDIGGGIVLVEDGNVLFELPLPLSGMTSTLEMETLINEEKTFVRLLRERGYYFEDPVYSLFFLQSTHLPYVRITQRGIYDVMHKTVLFPSIMR